jgi:hypothetical protein
VNALWALIAFPTCGLLGFWLGQRRGRQLYKRGYELAELADKELKHAAELLERVVE